MIHIKKGQGCLKLSPPFLLDGGGLVFRNWILTALWERAQRQKSEI